MSQIQNNHEGKTAGGHKRPASSNPADRRAHPRLPEDRPAWLSRAGTSYNVTMKDLSVGGACFISPRPASVGRPVQLQIGSAAAGAAADAIVVRNVARFDGQYEVSVRFTDDRSYAALAARFPSRAARMVSR